MDRDEVEVHINAKKERGQYLAILTEQACSTNRHLLYRLNNLQVKTTKTKPNMTVLLVQKFFTVGWCKIYFQAFLNKHVIHHGKLGILNCLNALDLKWFKGSMQLLTDG